MLRFTPEYKIAIWGGRRLETAFGRDLPQGPVGESWELAEIDAHASVVTGGALDGTSIGALWRDGRLGGSASGRFPLLLKWLDTHAFLSVQVHPDEAYRDRHGEGDPKTEAWLVARCEADALIYRGHRPGLDESGLRAAIADGSIAAQLIEHRPTAGELLLVPAGTLHAIGPGCLLLEVQQPSDTTYRAYDWGRLGTDGRPRELHVEQACRATRLDRPGAPAPEHDSVHTAAFTMTVLGPGAPVETPHALRVLAAHAGPARITGPHGETRLAPGEVIIAEPDDGCLIVTEGGCALIGEGTSG